MLRRPGRIVPAAAAHLRGRLVFLRPGDMMDWHSTGRREEVVIMLAGRAHLEVRGDSRRVRVSDMRLGQSVFLPQQTVHRLVNRSARSARYLYLTG